MLKRVDARLGEERGVEAAVVGHRAGPVHPPKGQARPDEDGARGAVAPHGRVKQRDRPPVDVEPAPRLPVGAVAGDGAGGQGQRARLVDPKAAARLGAVADDLSGTGSQKQVYCLVKP